jgi:hypothetical protein
MWLHVWVPVLAVVAGLLVTSCGGGSGGDASNGGVGSVAVLLTDGPSEEFDEINLTVTEVRLIGDDGDAVVFSGERTVNLLDLGDDSEVFSIADAPAGAYNKIRLIITALELVKRDEAGGIVEVIEPPLPANGKIDLNPRMRFLVAGDEPLVLQLDFDADKSFHIVQLGNGGYRFRPVVFVEIISGAVVGRYARLEGTVAEIDAAAQTFELCDSRAAFRQYHDGERRWGEWGHGDAINGNDGSGMRCVSVRADAETSIFNALGALTFEQIADGEQVTVFGRLVKNSGARGFTLHAQVIALGADEDFVYAKGTVTADYDAVSGQFEMDVTRSGEFTAGDSIGVATLDGTRVFTRSGLELGLDDITTGFGVKVFGIPTGAGAAPEMQALLVFLDDTSSAVTVLSGVTSAIDVDAGGLMLLGSALGDVCVRVDDDTDIFLLTSAGGNPLSEAITLAELGAGFAADVYGQLDLGSGCFKASNIIVQDTDSSADGSP